MTSNQNFKNIFSTEEFFTILYSVCDICKINDIECIVINHTSFNKIKYHNLLLPFCDQLKKYYHVSKHKYITNVNTYNKFVTIIRQICKANHIIYINKCVYIKSKYEPVFYILTAFPKLPGLTKEDLMELQEFSDASNIYLPNMVLLSNNCNDDSLANQAYLDLNNISSSDT